MTTPPRRLGGTLTLLLLAGCAAAPAAAPSATPEPGGHDVIAVVGVTVLPMTDSGGAVLRDRTVLVRGDRIAAVGHREDVPIPAGARRIDGAGRHLMPGLADMHVHLEYFQDPDVLKLFLAAGVTTVRNMDGRPYILEWRDAVAGGALTGPAIYTAGPLLDGDPPILPDNTVVRSAAEAEAAVIAQASAGYDFIKVYTNLDPEAYRAVLRTARARGLPVTGHVPRRVDLDEALSGGQASIEHLADYGDWIEADDSPFAGGWHWSKLYLAMPLDSSRLATAAARIAQSGVRTVPTLIQAHRALARPDSVREWRAAPTMAHIPAEGRALWTERLERTTARMDPADWQLVRRGRANRERLVRALHEAGAAILVGSDTPNPFVVPGVSALAELEHLVRAGLTPAAALHAATAGAARFMGDLDEWGTVEVGRRADLLLLEADPLEDIRNVARRAGLVVRGRWIPESELQGMVSGVVVR